MLRIGAVFWCCLVAACCATASPAGAADVRSGAWKEPHPRRFDPDDYIQPRAISVTFDNETGTLNAHLRFAGPVASVDDPFYDPEFDEISLTVSPQFVINDGEGSCGVEPGSRAISIRVSPSAPALIEAFEDLRWSLKWRRARMLPLITATLSPDEKELDITLRDDTLIGFSPICWSPYWESDGETYVGDHPLAGFSGLDGDVPAMIEQSVELSALDLAFELEESRAFHKKGATPGTAFREGTRCTPTTATRARCAVRFALPDVIGTPVLELTSNTEAREQATRYPKAALVFRHHMRGVLRWNRCPKVASARFAGKPCFVHIVPDPSQTLTQQALGKLRRHQLSGTR